MVGPIEELTGQSPAPRPIPADWAGEPRLVAFFIPMPISLGLPHGWTLTLDRPEAVDWLRKPSEAAPHTGALGANPSSDVSSFVSLRVWRPRTQVRLPGQSGALAMRVVHAVLGLDSAGIGDNPDVGPIVPSNATVLEAVTPLLMLTDGDPEGAVSAAFDRCLEEISILLRAYALAVDDVRIREWPKEALTPQIPFLTRTPNKNDWGALGLLTVNFGTSLPADSVELDGPQSELFVQTVAALKRGDPGAKFREWELRARRALDLDGDYPAAAIAIYAASETLFDALLLLLCWESAFNPGDVAQWLDDENLAKRIRSHYGPLIGGNWDTTAAKLPMGRWYSSVAYLRHLTIHAGYRPTRAEAQDAFSAMQEAVDFAKNRLIKNRNRYMRTTLILIGRPGLERRGLYAGKIRRFFEDDVQADLPWIASYNAWAASLPRR